MNHEELEKIEQQMLAMKAEEEKQQGKFYNNAERTDDSFEQEESLNMEFLNNIEKDAEKILEKRKSEDQENNKKKKSLFGKKKKKKQTVINLAGFSDDNFSSDNIIIVGTNTKAIKRATKTTFKAIASMITVGILSILVFLSLSYKIVPAKIIGANYIFGNYSLVSNANTPDLNAIKQGDKIIVNNKQWSPIVMNFDLYVVKSRDGGLINVINDKGYSETVEATKVDYILK